MDAKRIARYGYEKRFSLVAEAPVNEALERLQMLHTTRDHLVRNRAGIIRSVKEFKDCCGLKNNDIIISSQLKVIKGYDQEIAKLELQIAAIMDSEQTIKKNHQLLQSITAVGQVVSVATIIKTRNFTKFRDARTFASYCGTAPFDNTSGTSLRGKTRVSKFRDRDMNRLLDLAAKSAIQHDKELREFYLRRIGAGKAKMSTINIVRNKILYRMFAVIKRQTPFIKEYLQTA